MRKHVVTITSAIALISIAAFAGSSWARSSSRAHPVRSAEREDRALLGAWSVAHQLRAYAGSARAFEYQASRTGRATGIEIYIGAGSKARRLAVGIYSNRNGRPATLLASGRLRSPRARHWNYLAINPTEIYAGARYWLALLGVDGTLRYDDAGHRAAVMSMERATQLRSLPMSYQPRREYMASAASVYVSGTVSTRLTTSPRRAAIGRSPDVAPAADSPAPLWSADSLSWSQFGYQNYCPGQVSMVPDPLGSGASVIDMDVNDSCRPYDGATNPRADLESPHLLKPGGDLFFSDTFLIPGWEIGAIPSVRNSGSSFFGLDEIYGPPYGGAPATPGTGLQMMDGGDRVTAHFGQAWDTQLQWVGPVLDGRWHTITYHVHVDGDGSGWTEVYWDGQLQRLVGGETQHSYQVLVWGNNWDGSTGEMWNIQFYRAAGFIPGNFSVYHGYAAVGNTLSSVEPPAGWGVP